MTSASSRGQNQVSRAHGPLPGKGGPVQSSPVQSKSVAGVDTGGVSTFEESAPEVIE
jgi:hypothetical protein